MIAVVINPGICQSAYWYLFPECWGIAVYAALPLAFFAAGAVRRLAR